MQYSCFRKYMPSSSQNVLQSSLPTTCCSFSWPHKGPLFGNLKTAPVCNATPQKGHFLDTLRPLQCVMPQVCCGPCACSSPASSFPLSSLGFAGSVVAARNMLHQVPGDEVARCWIVIRWRLVREGCILERACPSAQYSTSASGSM